MTSATALGRNGVQDFIIQRATAVILGIYFVGLLGWFLIQSPVDHATWQALNACVAMQIVNTLVLLSLVTHTWIGVWSILTDYVTPARLQVVGLGNYATLARLACEFATFLWLFGSFAWGAVIIWAGA